MPDLTARAILVANQTLSGAFTTPDGVALANGDRVLAAGQTSSADNGFYTVAAGAWSRDGTVTYTRSMDIRILDGSEYGMSRWVYTAISSPTLGTTPLTFAQETKVPRSGA